MSNIIDVLLPVYNGSEFLRENIESVLKQSYKEFNFYICDDASTDDSLKIIQSYNDPRIIIVRNENNMGLFPTLNKLIKLSNSDVIHIWSQDDIMKEHCLAVSVEYYNKHQFNLAYSEYDYINRLSEPVNGPGIDNTPEIIEPRLFLSISIFYGSIAGNIANVCISRKAVENYGYFKEDFKVSADFEYWVRIGVNSNIIHIKESLVKLRNHENQLSRNYNSIILFILEDYQIFHSLFKNIQTAENLNIAKSYFRWKNEVLYFNNILFLIFKFQFKKAFVGIKILHENTYIVTLAFRWVFIRILRLLKSEHKFYNNLIHKYIV